MRPAKTKIPPTTPTTIPTMPPVFNPLSWIEAPWLSPEVCPVSVGIIVTVLTVPSAVNVDMAEVGLDVAAVDWDGVSIIDCVVGVLSELEV